ncbi:MAG: GTPase ObgE [Candidatus Doudnabacteria bacterium]|nr:GTPase ObgE [Candidatus Doudnabacteria bacterium]
MLIDEVRIKVKGGDGGNGIASFKNAKMEQGPTGGDGGSGGDVFLEGVSDLLALRQFRHKKNFSGKSGENGSNRRQDGAGGEDLILKVPVGTVAHNLDLKEDYEITKVGERLLIAHGARGGHGNFYFRSSTNITPRQFEYGHKAREFSFQFELKLIADVGFIGLPNVGKSSLLNALTRAQSKVANYHFTTLEPYLGAYYDLILADIPGLIEGASGGRGLGVKFLRHVARCTALFHLISCESSDPAADYQVVRSELEKFDPELVKKSEYLFLTKTDLVGRAEAEKKLKLLERINPDSFGLSILDPHSLQGVKKILNQITQAKIAKA